MEDSAINDAKDWVPSNEELTAIYYEANNLDPKKHHPITTERIFAAMRAMLKVRSQHHEK